MYTDKEGEVRVGRIVSHAVLFILAISFVFGCWGIVDAGERGVKVRLGNVVGTVEPGVYFKLPWIDTVHTFSVRTQSVIYERENPLTSASSDLQDVTIASVTNYHVQSDKVVELYTQYKSLEAFEEQVIRPRVRDSIKTVASQYTAGELVTKRSEFAEKAALLLNQRLEGTYVVVEQSNITDLQFSKSFSDAIEAKVTAVQQAEAAKNKLEQIKYEAQQTVETAKATAEAQRIQSASLAAQGGEDYVALKAIEKWNGILPQQMIPGSAVPFINLNNK